VVQVVVELVQLVAVLKACSRQHRCTTCCCIACSKQAACTSCSCSSSGTGNDTSRGSGGQCILSYWASDVPPTAQAWRSHKEPTQQLAQS
jgi:hypothetical protein